MSIKVNDDNAVSKFFKAYMKIVSEEMTRSLSYLGEQCVRYVRDRSQDESWIDHTGNLRSSVGYAVYDMGKKRIESEFPIVKQGSEGSEEGRKMIRDLAKLYSDTFALVVVAGMNYAEYVESMESKDVLASAELMAQSKINEYMAETRQMVEQRVSRELK